MILRLLVIISVIDVVVLFDKSILPATAFRVRPPLRVFVEELKSISPVLVLIISSPEESNMSPVLLATLPLASISINDVVSNPVILTPSLSTR